MPDTLLARLAEAGANAGARVVVDSNGGPLRAALSAGRLILINPNLAELEELADTDIAAERDQVIAAARGLISRHDVEALVVSLGAQGAVVVTTDLSRLTAAPHVEEVSRVGAGDSMVAGIVASLVAGETVEDAT